MEMKMPVVGRNERKTKKKINGMKKKQAKRLSCVQTLIIETIDFELIWSVYVFMCISFLHETWSLLSLPFLFFFVLLSLLLLVFVGVKQC